MFNIQFSSNKSILVLMCFSLVIISSGCISKKPREKKAKIAYSVFSKDKIEKLALKDNWGVLRSYLLDLDGDTLENSDQIYVLYWLGVAYHFTGRYTGAKGYWEKAIKMNPTGYLRKKLEKCLGDETKFDLEKFTKNDSEFMLQMGLFKLKRTATEMLNNLSWKRHRVFLDRVEKDGDLFWIVWMGPYTMKEARQKKNDLKQKSINSIVKPTLVSN